MGRSILCLREVIRSGGDALRFALRHGLRLLVLRPSQRFAYDEHALRDDDAPPTDRMRYAQRFKRHAQCIGPRRFRLRRSRDEERDAQHHERVAQAPRSGKSDQPMNSSGSTLREVGGAASITLRASRDQHRRALRRPPGSCASTSRPDFTEPTMQERCAQRIEAKRRTHRGSTAIRPRTAGAPPGTTSRAQRDSQRDAGATHAAQPPAQRTDTATTYATTKGRSPAGERTGPTERENQGRRAPARKTAGTSKQGREG